VLSTRSDAGTTIFWLSETACSSTAAEAVITLQTDPGSNTSSIAVLRHVDSGDAW